MSTAPEGFYLSGIELESPLMNAAGTISESEQYMLHRIEELTDTPIGAIKIGSITIPPQDGHEAVYGSPVYFYDTEKRLTYNAIGLRNIGLTATKSLMPRINEIVNDKPLIYSVSPTHSNEGLGGPDAQSVQLIEGLADSGASIIELNASCPNIADHDSVSKPVLGYDQDGMMKLIDTLKFEFGDHGEFKLGIKLPPYLSQPERRVAPVIAESLLDSEMIDFIVVSNTIGGQRPLDAEGVPILAVEDGKGGMSGPATAPVGREQLDMWIGLVNDQIDIVSSLGIYDGRELARRIGAGAVAGEVATIIFESQNLKSKVDQVLGEFVEAA
ncbi:MAG: hypothetical protein R3313_02010 [Candidatus Saccharimonadales bacterium]|nr:hypothetical protein [Candidatus Saccharimonadales bacterium]